ncbi:MAG: Lrp/AsnC family transcriptional regulator [Anaerolineales bacterium]|nr:Lrp/AsnC family transcriptional regulator [Anaerolineales bacterium]
MTDKATNFPFDQLDYTIIQQLHRDGRTQATVIARAIGADERTVRNRINRLISLGAIRIVAIADPVAFNYDTAADIFLKVETQKEAELVELFLGMRQVSYVAYGPGSGEISLEVRFKNNAGLREFLIHTLPAIPGVKDLSYTLVPQILKNIDEWLPGEEDFSSNGSGILGQ